MSKPESARRPNLRLRAITAAIIATTGAVLIAGGEYFFANGSFSVADPLLFIGLVALMYLMSRDF